MSPLQESYFVLTFSVDLRLFPNCRLSLWATLTTLELHRCISAAALFLRSRSPLFAWNILNNRQIMISSCAHLSYPLGVLLPYLFYKAFILCAQFHEHLCLCLQENSWFCCWQCKLAEESDKRVEEELSLEIQLGVWKKDEEDSVGPFLCSKFAHCRKKRRQNWRRRAWNSPQRQSHQLQSAFSSEPSIGNIFIV